MEAKDTVMGSDRALNISIDILGLDKIAEIGNEDSDLAFNIGMIQQQTAQAQAEITWDKAVREVMEWFRGELGEEYPFDTQLLDDKLKEWGIICHIQGKRLRES